MKSIASRLLTIGVVAGVAVVGGFVGRAVWDSVAQDVPKAEPPLQSVINEENASAKFEGELLGIHIAASDRAIPEKFITFEELCGDRSTVQVEWEKAGPLDLSVDLPEPFVFDPTSLNSGVIACGDTVYAARWDYSFTQPSGYVGRLNIARSTFKYASYDVSAGRVSVREIGGRPAILIKPLSPDGVSSASGVIFPGNAVTTDIAAGGIPESELLKVAEIIAKQIDETDHQ